MVTTSRPRTPSHLPRKGGCHESRDVIYLRTWTPPPYTATQRAQPCHTRRQSARWRKKGAGGALSGRPTTMCPNPETTMPLRFPSLFHGTRPSPTLNQTQPIALLEIDVQADAGEASRARASCRNQLWASACSALGRCSGSTCSRHLMKSKPWVRLQSRPGVPPFLS